MDRKFRQERDKALEEIQKALTDKIRDLAYWSQDFLKDKKDGLILPDYIKLQETFRWPAALMHAASDLKEDKSLKEIFSRVSARYDAKDPRKSIGIGNDLVRSPESKTDGRLSAFEDVLKLLDVAERDFDATYKALSRDQLEYWRKKHPIEDQHLDYAFRENQRHFMKESLEEMRKLVEDLRDGKPAPAATPKPPKP